MYRLTQLKSDNPAKNHPIHVREITFTRNSSELGSVKTGIFSTKQVWSSPLVPEAIPMRTANKPHRPRPLRSA